jgi:hypothetical protein
MSASPTTKVLADPVRAGYCQTGHVLILEFSCVEKEKEEREAKEKGQKKGNVGLM